MQADQLTDLPKGQAILLRLGKRLPPGLARRLAVALILPLRRRDLFLGSLVPRVVRHEGAAYAVALPKEGPLADGTIDAWHTPPEPTNWRSNAEPR